MAALKIEVQTNIPIVGTIKYADYSHSDYAKKEGYDPQLALNGMWNGEQGVLYTPLFLRDSLMELGALEDNGQRSNRGDPKYRVVDPSSVVTVLKAETAEGIRWTAEVEGAVAQPKQPEIVPVPTEVKRQVATNEQKTDRAKFKEMAGTLECCLAMACTFWASDTDPAVIQATGATLFIEANKRGIVLSPKKQKAPEPTPPVGEEGYNDEGYNAEDDLPF